MFIQREEMRVMEVQWRTAREQVPLQAARTVARLLLSSKLPAKTQCSDEAIPTRDRARATETQLIGSKLAEVDEYYEKPFSQTIKDTKKRSIN
jgi:hypothetical protein